MIVLRAVPKGTEADLAVSEERPDVKASETAPAAGVVLPTVSCDDFLLSATPFKFELKFKSSGSVSSSNMLGGEGWTLGLGLGGRGGGLLLGSMAVLSLKASKNSPDLWLSVLSAPQGLPNAEEEEGEDKGSTMSPQPLDATRVTGDDVAVTAVGVFTPLATSRLPKFVSNSVRMSFSSLESYKSCHSQKRS